MDFIKLLKLFFKYLILFAIGGITYNLIEILFRGYSHWTMFIVGGLCFVLIGLINEILSWDTPIIYQGLIGSIIVTTVEFISGYIINIKLGMAVWNYSDVPFNLLGQICLPFSIAWIFVSLIGIVADDYLRYWIFKEEKPRYRLTRKNKTQKQ